MIALAPYQVRAYKAMRARFMAAREALAIARLCWESTLRDWQSPRLSRAALIMRDASACYTVNMRLLGAESPREAWRVAYSAARLDNHRPL